MYTRRVLATLGSVCAPACSHFRNAAVAEHDGLGSSHADETTAVSAKWADAIGSSTPRARGQRCGGGVVSRRHD